MISYIQPLFIPDENQYQRNLNSIKSLIEYRKKYEDLEEIKFYFGGYCPNDEYWNTIKSIISANLKNSIILRVDKNVGKAFVVNKLYCFVNKYTKYLFTLDSDIILSLDEPYIFKRLVEVSKILEIRRNMKFGIIALNQKEHCCHLQSIRKNNIIISNVIEDNTYVESLYYSDSPCGYAGGCLFINKDLWEDVGGYKTLGVYEGDDAHLMLDAFNKNYSIQLSDSISIIHPYEKDIDYIKWKAETCGKKHFDKMDKYIEDADKFWESK